MKRSLMPEDRLQALTRRVRDGMRRLGEPARPWTTLPAGIDADVLIVGAGQCGLAAAFALKRAGVGAIRLVSRDAAGAEGPWRSFARMPTLRSPKTAPGPELGLPDLTYECWHKAVYGDAAYDALDLIHTEDWALYIDWFREVVDLPIDRNRSLVDLDGTEARVVARFSDGGSLSARQVVLATGMDALGGPAIPRTFARLPEALRPHCYGPIDFDALNGRRVAVIGAGSTAFDNAAEALEAGAGAVDLYCREPALRAVNHMKGVADYGAVAHWADFDDAARWRFARLGASRSAPPTGPTVARAVRWPNFRILLRADIRAAGQTAKGVEIDASGVRRVYDRVLIATGYGVDPDARPETARLQAAMARWSDRYQPPPGDADPTLAAYPYLTPGFAFVPRDPKAAPWLDRVRLFAGPTVASMGRIAGESGNLRYGAPRLATAVCRALALEDRDALFDRAAAYDVRETVFEDYAARTHPADEPD